MLQSITAKKWFFALSLFLGGAGSAWAIDLDQWHPLDLELRPYQPNLTEKRVLHITSDAMEGWTDVLVDFNEKLEVQFFRLVTSSGNAMEFDLAKLKEGAVVKTEHGVGGEVLNVITLQSDSFDRISGGGFKLIYLVNGAPFFHKVDEFDSRLRPDATGQWRFDSGNDGQPFNSMFMKGNRLFGKLIGIESVDVNWDDQVKYNI